MSTEINSVGKVLVATGDQGLLNVGDTLGDLAVGQIGILNASTHLGIQTGTTATEFYVAAKLADGKIVKTNTIKGANLRYADTQAYVAGVAPVIDVKNICTSCSTDYVIRVELLAANAFVTFGFQSFTKVYSGRYECCSGTTDPCVDILTSIRDTINADEDNLFTATLRNPADNTLLNDAALAAWDTAADGCPNLRLTGVAQSISDFCGIPFKYSFPTGVAMQVFAEGFDCCSPAVSTTVVTAITYPQGEGPDVKYEEWFNSHTNQDVNGLYTITKEGVFDNVQLNASHTLDYDAFIIAYNAPHRSGFLSYDDPQTLVIYLEDDADTTAGELDTALEALLGVTLATVV